MKKHLILAALAATLCSPIAWAQGYGQAEAPAVQARAPLPVKTGKVLDVQTVRIQVPAKESTSNLGGIIGAAAGAFLAKDGTWQSQALAGTIGAAVGSKVGQSASQETREAVQVIVKLDDGQALAIIQEQEGEPLKPGQAVFPTPR